MSSFKASDKVWVYTSPQKLSEDQKDYILKSAEEFLNSWESHGDKVKGEIAIAYDHFIIIVADDCSGNMCGRAQDAQIRFIKEIGEKLHIDFTDRMQIAYRATASDEILVKKMPDFRKEINSGAINEHTVVFNNMVTDYAAFNTSWEVELKDSWHKQLIA